MYQPEMYLSRTCKIAGIAFVASMSLALLSGPSQASCKQHICVHGSDDGNVHNVWIESSYYAAEATHYNVRFPDGRQFEVSVNDTRFSFKVKPGRKYRYGVQACKGGGFLEGSTCGPWVSFEHTVKKS